MAHLMVFVSGNKNVGALEASQIIKDYITNKYKTVQLYGSGYSFTSQERDLHFYCSRDHVAKSIKKWLTTNKKKFGITRVDLMTDKQYSDFLGDD